jgi:small subunit ribosomal protein S9
MVDQIHTVGKRKTSVARVYMKPGKGTLLINKRDVKDYFPEGLITYKVFQPIVATNSKDSFDFKINVYGGGFNSQAEAIRLAIARALCKADIENKIILKPLGLLKNDTRIVEPKKYGHKKARRSFQFSKR